MTPAGPAVAAARPALSAALGRLLRRPAASAGAFLAAGLRAAGFLPRASPRPSRRSGPPFRRRPGRRVDHRLHVVAGGVVDEGAVVVGVVVGAQPGGAVVPPPAASPAAWKASTAARDGAAKATCCGEAAGSCTSQKSGLPPTPRPSTLGELHDDDVAERLQGRRRRRPWRRRGRGRAA